MARTVADLDGKVQRLLNAMQDEIPLVRRPYEVLGGKVGMSEDAVLDALRELKADRILRQCSAIFDTRSLGYRSSLVAARIDPGRADEAAAAFNAHPGVSHNYAREHAFNLWFTIAVPGDSALEEHIEVLRAQSGAEAVRLLPTLRLFKIGMKIDTTGGHSAAEKGPAYSERDRRSRRPPLTERDREHVRALQVDMEVCAEPFTRVAERLGATTEALLEWCRSFQAQGRLRRVAGVMNHRIAGFEANGMGVWAVPDSRIAEAVKCFVSEPAVTHCYLRPTYPDWPYNVFTMVHQREVDACDALLARLSGASRVREYAILYSTKQYKKIRLQYFTGGIAAWERANGLKPGSDG